MKFAALASAILASFVSWMCFKNVSVLADAEIFFVVFVTVFFLWYAHLYASSGEPLSTMSDRELQERLLIELEKNNRK
jgi:hypothetical protein